MSLKSLIQRLLDSRTTPAQAEHSAMPSSTPTTISSPTSITSWGTITTFTAPDDGYVTFHGRSMAGAAAQIASLPLENNPTVITATQDNYQGMSCNLPVVKGKTVEVYGSNIESIVVSFNRLIGGYNSFVRRAVLCLKPSFNFLLRSFSRVNGKQSKLGIFQKSETRLHSHQRQGKTLFTRLQRTDTFKSSCETARRAKNSPSLCTQEEMKTAVQGRNSKILMDGFLYIYPFSRVKLSRFSAQELSQTLSLRSIRTTNPQTGGALC